MCGQAKANVVQLRLQVGRVHLFFFCRSDSQTALPDFFIVFFVGQRSVFLFFKVATNGEIGAESAYLMLAAVSLYRRIKSISNYKTVKKAQKNSQRIKLSKCA
ncbi:MAG: hypothetical protein K8R85_12010, partial [Bacteroidetes bacterium]|nr:hypothetical protein [Bacteroidota bacterium]